uniref:zinc finger CCHC domain-containing protein 8 n=1 Tax=Pristiophorus japonicus TaxID=55135 RepID=UPI00398F8B01
MAAERVELDFGDRQLFEEFEDSKPSHVRFTDSEDAGETEAMKGKLQECEESVGYLKAENQELRRKLNLLTQPSKIVVSDSKTDGPMVQILFMNNNISKQFHQEIEDFITGLAEKYEKETQSDPEKTSFNVKPQPSSVLLEEHLEVKTLNTVKRIKDAFHVVGSVQYFTNFCLDKLGQPLLNENPQLTDGWEIPKYQQVFTQVVSLDGQVEMKAKRPKPCCFNCGSTEHQLKDCPKPRDLARISEKRKEFMTMASDSPHSGSQQRYHAERFEKFKPGVISAELKEALGMTDETLPPFIYRMRQLGYPPGWLLETLQENSGLALYDGKDSSDGEMEHDKHHLKTRLPSYDTSKLIDYAGFNAVIPKGIQDEWRLYASIPMQSHQLKEHFAHQLNANDCTTKNSSNKRGSDTDSSLRSVKKRKSEEIDTNVYAFDMDIDSGSETPPRPFPLVPPIPPGCPLTSSPPPLPKGTPPSTPPTFVPPAPPTPTRPPLPKDTPPSTPNCSPAGHSLQEGNAQAVTAEIVDADVLSLEELEEQQRLIWAALEQTESTNSETDGPCDSPVTKISANSSPAINPPDNCMEIESNDKMGTLIMGTLENNMGSPSAEASSVDSRDEQISLVGHTSNTGENTEPENSGMEIEGSRTIQDSTTPEASIGGNQVCLEKTDGSITSAAVSEAQQENRISSVPDMSKFATGITPFEYDNLSKATGTYLKLRSLLKNSPRNKMKKK